MPKKYDRCVKKVKRKIVVGKIPKTYKSNGRKKTNPYAICRASMKKNMTKKELLQKIKSDVIWYAQPRRMSELSKKDLQVVYNEAKKLKLLKK